MRAWGGRALGARVRKSRQKEAAGAADAVLMQIEWSEGEVLKEAGARHGSGGEVRECVGGRIDGGKRWRRGREVGIGSGAGLEQETALLQCGPIRHRTRFRIPSG